MSRYWTKRDKDGHCTRCGILWEDAEVEGESRHECPPGFWKSLRRAGRAVDCTGLETPQTRKGFAGSNPALSAKNTERCLGDLRRLGLYCATGHKGSNSGEAHRPTPLHHSGHLEIALARGEKLKPGKVPQRTMPREMPRRCRWCSLVFHTKSDQNYCSAAHRDLQLMKDQRDAKITRKTGKWSKPQQIEAHPRNS